MNVDLSGSCAVITGGSSGLGYAMAEALLEHGATVAISSRSGERLESVVAAFQEKGYRAISLPMDVRDETQVSLAAESAIERMGKIDLLVNNAGIGMPRVNPDFITSPQPFHMLDAEAVRDVIDTNFLGCFIVAKYFVKPMLIRQSGRIVHVSTSLTTMVKPFLMPYGPAKAGAEAFTNIMAEELKEYGILVNVLLPGGAVNTPLLGEKNRTDVQRLSKMLDPVIMKDPILFLASDWSKDMTGQRIIATEFANWLEVKGIAWES